MKAATVTTVQEPQEQDLPKIVTMWKDGTSVEILRKDSHLWENQGYTLEPPKLTLSFAELERKRKFEMNHA